MEFNWHVRFLPAARREFRKLDDSVKAEASEVLRELSDDPFLFGAALLRGYTDLYRIKFYREQYRIVYQVAAGRRVVIWRVRPRSEAYIGLRNPSEI